MHGAQLIRRRKHENYRSCKLQVLTLHVNSDRNVEFSIVAASQVVGWLSAGILDQEEIKGTNWAE